MAPPGRLVPGQVAGVLARNRVQHRRVARLLEHLEGLAPHRLSVLLSVGDDGRGFDPAQVPQNRLGLGIMQERAAAIGAHLSVESQPGQGTQVTVLWEQSCEGAAG